MVISDNNPSARSKPNAIDMFDPEVEATHPIVHSVNHDNEDQSSQSSVPLPASSPLTDRDDHTESEVEDGKKGTYSSSGRHSNKILGRRAKIEATAIPRHSAKGRAPLSPSPSPSIADNLRRVLHKLERYRLGKPLVPPDCEQIDLALEPAEYHQLYQLLYQPELQAHDFDCDLAALRRWAPNKLRHDYDPRAAVFTIRMLGPLHQKLVEGFKSIILDRLSNALATSGYKGTITGNTGIDAIFKEPEPEPQPESWSSTTHRARAIPQRSRSQNKRPEVGTTDLGPDNGSNEPSETSPASVQHTYSPDFGIYYAPHDGQEPYFPGIIVEAGWSHPLPDWKAKRYIRYGKGNVRYVMALNVEHQPKHGAMPDITIQAHEIASDQESWVPAKCLHAYDVRANAEVEARGAGGGAAETDVGLRLSHLHELLVPRDYVDIPITLPLRKLVDMVESAYSTQVRRDAVKTGQASPPPATSFRGKRCRTATPVEDDEAALLRDPNASYIPQDPPASSKRRRTDQGRT
ncbi:hypothetical protein F5883DRAFT_571108 [Diaporthe sp. PMI_573]|nr:hypothetical protein F5883DRAFT_571108 [Diaporthaceae sp. PMI_573]